MNTKQFDSIYLELAPFVFKLAYSKLFNKEDAEELVQDVFLVVFEKYDQFRGDSQLKTWVYKITYRKIQDHYKAQNRNKRTFERSSNAQNIENFELLNLKDLPAPTQSETDKYENFEMILYQVLSTLNQEQQWVFRLSWELKLTNQEISEILEKSIKAIESIRFRTMSKIREELSKKYDQIYGESE